jgi:alpha-amylase/alpha-mannosidase (GH57 family)
MPKIYVCFVWHMHQPFYKDLVTGEYQLPWTRMHALKDYYGMVKVLEEFPAVHQTFNLVPSMMVQIDEYAEGKAADPFLRCALKPAEELTESEQEFILRYFFQANAERLIGRYPRYQQLKELKDRAPKSFGARDFRDLQVLSQLAWFDEEFLTHDAEVRDLVAKRRDYSLADQQLMGRKQIEIVNAVGPVYKEFAARGQIELSTTPFYHPILPLLCDTAIAGVSHPNVPLPRRFMYPQDAIHQLASARRYMDTRFGKAPVGLWPSEGSVSDDALTLAADMGYKWFATDNGVLARTLGRPAGPWETYRPYVWRRDGREMGAIFRDHHLSDLIGFVYSRMGAAEAASHFMDRIYENCGGRESLVPIILDGENAWEYYHESGREFLRELYRRISNDHNMEALTVSEALTRMEPTQLESVFPGSWINANFDVWIGAEEDNKAWDHLLRARETYDRCAALATDAQSKLAYEELLIAEGSDWCWWYGPEHDSDNRPEFDRLFRDHLANVYRALGLTPPEELSRPILKLGSTEIHEVPMAWVYPTLDGEVTSYFEWMGAGRYHVDGRSGAMHGDRFPLQQFLYGVNETSLSLRLDFDSGADLSGLELRLRTPSFDFVVPHVVGHLIEASTLLSALDVESGAQLKFQLSIWQNGLPMASLPQEGWLEFSTEDPL